MFAKDDSKRKFVENARIEREKREAERQRLIAVEEQTKAAVTIQRCWKRHQQQYKAKQECWAWWDEQFSNINTMTITDLYQLVGIYCKLSRGVLTHSSNNKRLKQLVKCMTNTNKLKDKQPYYVLLIDMRYMVQARVYLEMISIQCIKCCISSNELSSFGPELTFLLQYLNPKTYHVKRPLDVSYTIDISDKILQSIGQAVLKTTLCQYNLRDAQITCVEHIIKLENRKSKDAKTINALKLWLTTITRLSLYPIEHAELSSDALDMGSASKFLWKNTMAVPYLSSLVNELMIDRLRKWALDVANAFVLNDSNIYKECIESLDGNGLLFVLGNIVNLWNNPKNTLRTEEEHKLVEWVQKLLVPIRHHFSNKQTAQFSTYHPLFKWTDAAWGNDISSNVFDKVILQLQHIWSGSLIDTITKDITQFLQLKSSLNVNYNSKMLTVKGNERKLSSSNNLSLLSMKLASTFAMYIDLSQLFKQYKRVIISEIDKEPLIQILRVFCEACSILFMTLDDVDIFERKYPFSPEDLVQISKFLNSFYFILLQQSTSVPSELPPAAEMFVSARQLLLQIYDLDLHHQFCPPDHWLLISTTTGIKSFFTSFMKKLDSNTDNDTAGDSESNNFIINKNWIPTATMFLKGLKENDPVPLRILQLMPYTIPFNARLKVFRDWVILDKSCSIRAATRHISVRRNRVLEDGYNALADLPANGWKNTIRVSFVNELGVAEAGIDQGGPFKDFLTMLISEAFQPGYGLFTATRLNSFYPSLTSFVHGTSRIELFGFIGKVIIQHVG
ncbi:hypothetical protein BDF20DRAFT_817457 [Mycotypha africana]|uniref:uncharacterized protein n=1 Tax=Mycotypha africana TaxID=64632 RepID=UPI0023001DC0|nr:uncharacterized protein BDF20DRAFT_817457 [Mycotypha africana]KAI8982003.1 hypothetical protein BDF20DRAFT_817457 [Mycotypha africana]